MTTATAVRLKGMFALGSMLFFLPSGLLGGDDPTTRATLRGIRGIVVVVESLAAEASKDGLTVDMIQTDTELSLRKAGIRVMDSRQSPPLSYLYLSVNLIKEKGQLEDLYVYNCHIAFEQPATVKSNGVLAIVPTWSVDGVGSIGRNRMSRLIRDRLQDLVEAFLNAYLSVNPK
jgi:hypothetical protein